MYTRFLLLMYTRFYCTPDNPLSKNYFYIDSSRFSDYLLTFYWGWKDFFFFFKLCLNFIEVQKTVLWQFKHSENPKKSKIFLQNNFLSDLVINKWSFWFSSKLISANWCLKKKSLIRVTLGSIVSVWIRSFSLIIIGITKYLLNIVSIWNTYIKMLQNYHGD